MTGVFTCVLFRPPAHDQAVYVAPEHDLGDVFDVATPDVVVDSLGSLVQSTGT